MTTPFIPDFIFSMFQSEISGIVDKAIRVIADEHSLNEDKLSTLVRSKLDLNVDLISDKEEKVKIVKCKPRKIPEAEDRCIARVNNKEAGVIQCRFKHLQDCQFCKRHSKKETNYGTIIDPVNKCPKEEDVLKSRRIRKIY